MLEITKICSISFEKISLAKQIVCELEKLAREAQEMSKLIHKTHKCFGIGESEVKLFVDKENDLYHCLKQCGVWVLKNKHNEKIYGLNLAPTVIYECLKCEFMLQKKYVNSNHRDYIYYENSMETLKHFRKFIEFTKK